ncbi:MAG: hypothetical protein RIT05_1166 [Bacteroidota bacterium]|jgi:hypothetical protein
MKSKYLIVTLLTSILIGCKSDPFEIKNNEQLKITTISMGCFHFENYETTINKEKNRYYVSICKIHLPEPGAGSIHNIVKEGIMTDIWERPTYNNFIEQIKKEGDTTNFSTTNVFHEIEINGMPLKRYRANENYIFTYIEKHP